MFESKTKCLGYVFENVPPVLCRHGTKVKRFELNPAAIRP